MLTHTSGLRDAFGLLGWSDPAASVDLQNETIVQLLARQRGINFPPGTEYQYNNGGYALLASILQRTTGQSLLAFADANIFRPLGMVHTYVHDDPSALVPNRASGYSMLRSYLADDVDFEMTPTAPNRFVLLGTLPFEFVPAAPGRPKEWRVGQGEGQDVAKPVTFTLAGSEFQQYAGAYRSEEIGVTYTLEARNAMLIVRSSRPDIVLTPFSKDVFVGDSVGVVRFSRDPHGMVTSFTPNRDNVRGVRFERTLAH